MDNTLYQEKKDFAELESVARFWVEGMWLEIKKLLRYFFSGFLLTIFLYFWIKDFLDPSKISILVDLSSRYFDYTILNYEKILNIISILWNKGWFTNLFLVFILLVIWKGIVWKQIKNIYRNLLHFTKLERFVFFLFGILVVFGIFKFNSKSLV